MPNKMPNKIGLALLIGILALAPGMATAQKESHSMEQMISEMADTPADHAALAKHYRAKAVDARAEAAQHEKMGRTYNSGKDMQRLQMKKHCDKITADLTSMANEYDALAKLHDDGARK